MPGIKETHLKEYSVAATPPSFCPQCRTPLQGNQRFCTNCGTTIETHAGSATVAASNTPSTPSAPPVVNIPGGQTAFAGGQPNQGTGTVPASFTPDAFAQQPYSRPNERLVPPPPPGTISNKSTYMQSNESLQAPPPPPPVYNPYGDSLAGGPPSYAQTTLPQSYGQPTVPPNTYTPQPVAVPPIQSGGYQVPDYAKKQKGNGGCVTVSVILLLVLAIGIGGTIYWISHRPSSSNTGNNPGASSTTGSGTNSHTPGTTPTAATHPGSTQQLNLQFTYASVQITITSVAIAPQFTDDTSTNPGSAGVARVNMRENNPSSGNPDYLLGDSMHLLLPGGNSIAAGNEQQPISPAQGVNRTNWVDFALDSQVQINQLTLRIGKQTENQMDIPLQSNANLGKYQDKTSSPNAQFKYGGVDFTIKTATLSYSTNDYQASTGNRYLIVTLAGNNTTSNAVSTYPSTYMRLKVGSNSLQPDNSSTLPFEIAPNTSASGTIVFLVPQDATSFTLVMLAQTTSPPINQVTQDFQVQ